MITVTLTHSATQDKFKFSPMQINIPRGELNENLQHVAQSCQLTAAYEPELLEILALRTGVPATVEDETGLLFTGIIDTGATWTDNGFPTPIDSLQLKINDNTYLLDTQSTDEVALIATTLSAVIERICQDCKVTISADTQLPVTALKAFVMDAGTNYLQALNNLLFQHELAFIFNGKGELVLLDFSTPPEKLANIGGDKILTGFSTTRTTKKYGAVKIGYTSLTEKNDQQVYFEGNDLGEDNKIVPITIRPGQYYPYESEPIQEEREGQVYQEFSEGYAESYQAYNGETKYRRSQKTSLLYTENQRLVQDWQGSIVVDRTDFQSRRASVRLRNTGTQDANLMQLAIRADAWYREPTSYVTSGTGSEYVYEGEYLYTAEAAEKLSKTLSRFFLGGNFKLSGRLTQPVNIGQFVHIDTGVSGFVSNALCLSCSFEPESEIYSATFITYGDIAIDTSRYKAIAGHGDSSLSAIVGLSQKIEGIMTGDDEEIGPPDIPQGLTAIAGKDSISISWLPPKTGLKNIIKEYVIQVKKGNTSWGNDWESSGTTTQYIFFRSEDGYPEATELSSWRIRVKAVNIYGKESEEWGGGEQGVAVNTDTYGTWKLSAPKIVPQVRDRHVTLLFSQPPRADNRQVYGDVQYDIWIRRPDIDTNPDVWYTPGTTLNAFPETRGDGTSVSNELNYKLDTTTPETRGEMYVQTMPLKGQGGNGQSIENTPYLFKVLARNEAGESPFATVQALALCTNIVDLVNANMTQKEAYVPDLAAISANLGSINQGAMGNDNNRWDLSTFVDTKGIQRWEGLFRVGGDNQYFHVNPVVNDIGQIIDYRIDFKVGKFELTSVTSNIKGEVIVMAENVNYERTRITPTGTYYEYKADEDGEWQTIARQTTSGLLSQVLFSEKSLLVANSSIESRRERGLDIGRQYLSDNCLVYHFDTNYFDQHNTSPTPYTIDGTAQLVDASDNSPLSSIDFTPAIIAVAPYSEVGKSAYGRFSLTYPLGSPENLALDFWVQFVWSENTAIFEYGDDDMKIRLVSIVSEPYYNVPQDDEPPYNYEIDEISELPYNVITKMDSFIQCERKWIDPDTGKTLYDTKNISLDDYNIELVQNVWMHIGIGKDATSNVVYINSKAIHIPDFVPEAKQIVIGDKKSFQLDELMVDTAVTLDAEGFLSATIDKIPWGSLDYQENHFILDAFDKNNIKGNVMDLVRDLIKDSFVTAEPPGKISMYMGLTAPYGYLLCDGAEYDVADYPILAPILLKLPFNKGLADGKFRVPDLRKRVPEGASDNLGAYIEAGLPNITGTFSVQGCDAYRNIATGAFRTLNTGTVDSGTSNSGGYLNRAGFDASKGETKTDGTLKTDDDYKVYGKSDTVQPNAFTTNYIIKT